MVKLGSTLLNLLIILVLQIFPGGVSVKMDVPGDVQAGSEFEVKITLNKGDLEGFSRFQQNIPAGLTAVPVTSSNADFTFSEKRVRLIWLRTPQSDEVTVTYKVKVDERLKGTFNLSGKYSYIENNERKFVDIDPIAINITPSPTIDPSLIVDINDFEKLSLPMPGLSPDAVNIACIRQKPYAGSQGDYVVNILVKKNLTRQFAKIEETVPQGYTAVAMDPKDAIFTFKDQKVKFLWMNLPDNPFFTVSYRLIPKNQANVPAPQIIGAFSYLVDQKSVSVDILERDLNIAEVNSGNVDQMIAMAISQPSTQTEQVAETVKPADAVNTENQDAKQTANTDIASNTEKKTPPKKTKPAASSAKNTIPSSNADFLDMQDGVFYRIQLAAGHKPVNVNRYFKKMNLDKEVRRENHDGWTKYSVGSFAEYKDARDYRVHIWNTTPVKDAFITAYNSGKRITVQEALMITEQKWYR